jgi:hypothetical protein
MFFGMANLSGSRSDVMLIPIVFSAPAAAHAIAVVAAAIAIPVNK